MARASRLLRTVRMFVDSEDCGERCVTSQVVIHIVQLTDGTCDAVISDPSDPSRRIVRRGVDADDLIAFLEFAAALNSVSTP